MARLACLLLVVLAFAALSECKDGSIFNFDFSNTLRGLGKTPYKWVLSKAAGFRPVIDKTVLRSLLHNQGSWTLLVVDQANAASVTAFINEATSTQRRLDQVAKYHLIPGTFLAADLTAAGANGVTTYEGSKLVFTTANGVVSVKDATGASYDLATTNYVIDNGVLGPNFVIHTVKGLVRPLNSAAETARASTNPSLATLVSLLDADGLSDALHGSGSPVILFAPTDAAFTAAIAANPTLASDTNFQINTLKYHVATNPNKVTALTAGSLTMSNGAAVTVAIAADGKISITDARNNVATATGPIAVSNGVLYTVDKVLLPPA